MTIAIIYDSGVQVLTFQVFSTQTQLEYLKKAQNERVEFRPRANETDFTVNQLFTFLNHHRFDSVFNLLSIMTTTTISLKITDIRSGIYFMLPHIYLPLIGRGWGCSSLATFPTHNPARFLKTARTLPVNRYSDIITNTHFQTLC